MSDVLITNINSLLYNPELLSGEYSLTILYSSRLFHVEKVHSDVIWIHLSNMRATLNDAMRAGGLFSLQEFEEVRLTSDRNIATSPYFGSGYCSRKQIPDFR